MAIFDDYTVTDATEHIRPPGWLDENRRFVGTHDSADDGEPDHWQRAKGFLMPIPEMAEGRDAYVEGLKKMFVVEDLITDIVERRTAGVLGKPPRFSVEAADLPGTPADEAAAADARIEADEAAAGREGVTTEEEARQAAIAQWFDEKGVHDVLRQWAETISVEGKACLRLYVPPTRLQVAVEEAFAEEASTEEASAEQVTGTEPMAELPQETDITTALSHIFVECSRRDESVVHIDRMSREEVGVTSFVDDEEGQYVDITYLNDDGLTVRKVLRGDLRSGDVPGMQAPLRGHLMMHEGRLKPIVSSGLKSSQRDLNTKRTMIAISDSKAGFPDVKFVDVLPPTDDQGNETAPRTGPGSYGFYFSAPSRNVQMQDGREVEVERSPRPSITESDPVDNTNLRENAEMARFTMYRIARQLHIFMSGDAGASGESRIQARADFVADLEHLSGEVNRAGVWLLEAVWALAEYMIGQAPSEDLRASFECVLDPGPLTSDERRAIIEAYKNDLYSKRTTMSMLGVNDLEGELQRIEDEQAPTGIATGGADADIEAEIARIEDESPETG